MPSQRPLLVYIGTYTQGNGGRGEGIYCYQLDPNTGALTYASLLRGVVNPSYLAIDAQRRFLYAVNETARSPEWEGGALSAFALDERGELTFLNQQPSGGTAPCYVSIERTGRYALVANYSSGSLSVYPIKADGQLGAASDSVQHSGAGYNAERQAGPHLHCIVPDPNNRFALAADLGIDRVITYEMDLSHGRVEARNQLSTAAGTGPRHLAFHPTGRYVYLLNELDSTISALSYDAATGELQTLQTEPLLPADFDGESYGADVHVAPSGQFVYASNRGHDSIAIFAVDERTGTLTLVAHESTQGHYPRNFALDPMGSYLLVANQHTDNLVVFRVDARTGLLMATGDSVGVPSPVCVKIV